jgi:zinc/manganese transport system substrate-binding protein
MGRASTVAAARANLVVLVALLAVLLLPGLAIAAPIRILAAESVYGDIARQIGGAEAQVKSVLNSPAQDPHAFEASPSLARDVAQADIVILNGAGYDPWMERLLEGASNPARRVIDVAALTGHKVGDNPHLWFHPATPRALAKALEDGLSTERPEAAAAFSRNAEEFLQSLQPLEAAIATIAQSHKGVSVAATEPVFGYMFEAMGFSVQEKNFQLAAMNEVEPSVSDIARFEADLKSRSVKLLLHNAQTSGALAEKMMGLAQQSGIPVVGVTETLPPGRTYQAWIGEEIAAIAKALEASP